MELLTKALNWFVSLKIVGNAIERRRARLVIDRAYRQHDERAKSMHNAVIIMQQQRRHTPIRMFYRHWDS